MSETRDPPDVVIELPHIPAAATPAIVVFALATALLVASFAAPVLLLTRSALPRDEAVESAANVTAARAAPARTPAPAAVRVQSAAGTAELISGSTYRVTFLWTLDGARDGDTIIVRFAVGDRVVREQRGALDPAVFTSATGRLTIPTQQECATEGWAAELVAIRGQPPQGDAISRVAGVRCV